LQQIPPLCMVLSSMKNSNNVILIGMKHCGKTSTGKRLAKELDEPFFDMDDLIMGHYERENGKRKSIEDIFRDEGASNFYRIEAYTCRKFFKSENARREAYVLAVGGRTPLNPLIENALWENGIIVHIDTPLKTILERVSTAQSSIFLDLQDPEVNLRELYDIRRPIYISKAHFTVDGDGEMEMILEKIQDGLKEFTP